MRNRLVVMFLVINVMALAKDSPETLDCNTLDSLCTASTPKICDFAVRNCVMPLVQQDFGKDGKASIAKLNELCSRAKTKLEILTCEIYMGNAAFRGLKGAKEWIVKRCGTASMPTIIPHACATQCAHNWQKESCETTCAIDQACTERCARDRHNKDKDTCQAQCKIRYGACGLKKYWTTPQPKATATQSHEPVVTVTGNTENADKLSGSVSFKVMN